MPFAIRPHRRFPVQCAVTNNGGLTTGERSLQDVVLLENQNWAWWLMEQ